MYYLQTEEKKGLHAASIEMPWNFCNAIVSFQFSTITLLPMMCYVCILFIKCLPCLRNKNFQSETVRNNSYDCGVYVCAIAVVSSRLDSLRCISEENMPLLRNQMFLDIGANRLTHLSSVSDI